MINVNKRMYLTNQHKYILSSQQDTGSMNIKGRTWENNKIQRHFDGTVGDNTAIVFKNLSKTLNIPHVNINLMQFNTFSTQVDIRSLTISINEGSKGYLNVTYGAGYNSYTETLISNLPNSNITPESGKKLEIINKFEHEPTPILGTITLEPKSKNNNQDECDQNSFRGVVTLTYKIANKLTLFEQVATCKIYFIPYPKLRIVSIDECKDFIIEPTTGTLIYPNPTKLKENSLKNELMEGIYTIPFEFTNSFGIDDKNTFIETQNMSPNQQAIISYINNLLISNVNMPNYYNFMYFSENNFKVEWGNVKNTIQYFNIVADKNIYAGKIIVKSHTTICDTHDDIILALTFDNSQNIGYIKTIYSDIAPLTKVLSIINSSSNNVSVDLLAPKSNNLTAGLTFDQTVTVIVKNQSLNDIKIKINETISNSDCEGSSSSDSNSLYDNSLYDNSLYDNSLYEECNNNNNDNSLYDNNCNDNANETSQIIKPGNYAVFERVLFSPSIWEASGQTKIVIRKPQLKGKGCCK